MEQSELSNRSRKIAEKAALTATNTCRDLLHGTFKDAPGPSKSVLLTPESLQHSKTFSYIRDLILYRTTRL